MDERAGIAPNSGAGPSSKEPGPRRRGLPPQSPGWSAPPWLGVSRPGALPRLLAVTALAWQRPVTALRVRAAATGRPVWARRELRSAPCRRPHHHTPFSTPQPSRSVSAGALARRAAQGSQRVEPITHRVESSPDARPHSACRRATRTTIPPLAGRKRASGIRRSTCTSSDLSTGCSEASGIPESRSAAAAPQTQSHRRRRRRTVQRPALTTATPPALPDHALAPLKQGQHRPKPPTR